MIDRAKGHGRIHGFTLVEGIMVIVLLGAFAAVAGAFIVQPFIAANDMTRRAELVDSAETALDRMTREIRLAVPNSVRIKNDALEFLRSTTGGRYRRLPDESGNGDPLDPSAQSDSFDVLGGLPGGVSLGSSGRACADSAAAVEDCIVINNTGTPGFNAYSGDNVAALTGAAPSADAAVNLTFNIGAGSVPPAFRAHSAHQRFQVLDTVVSYVCSANRIDRYDDYGLNASQQVPPSGSSANLLARDVTACDFSYDAGAGERYGLVSIDMTLERDGEVVRIVDQAHVVNVP